MGCNCGKEKTTKGGAKLYKKKLSEKQITKFSKQTGFKPKEITLLYEYYVKISASIDDDGIIDADEFEEALGLSGSAFAERMFKIIDVDGNGQVDFDEFLNGLKPFTSNGTFEERLKFTFQVYDINGDGTIDADELKTLLRACLHENFLMNISEQELDEIVKNTFEQVDTDSSGDIDYQEFANFARKTPQIMDNLKIELPILNQN